MNGSAKRKSPRSKSWTSVPRRFVIRIWVLTVWTTLSGPTATHGSGGSNWVLADVLLFIPAKPVDAAGRLVVCTARSAGGAAAVAMRGTPVEASFGVVWNFRLGCLEWRPRGRSLTSIARWRAATALVRWRVVSRASGLTAAPGWTVNCSSRAAPVPSAARRARIDEDITALPLLPTPAQVTVSAFRAG